MVGVVEKFRKEILEFDTIRIIILGIVLSHKKSKLIYRNILVGMFERF